MGRKLKLLPHWCQTAGYTYILIFISCVACALICMTGIFPDDSRIVDLINTFHKCALTHWNFVGVLNFIMIFLAIFSKEKVEDEMTTSIRLDALLYLVFFLFAVHLLLYLPDGSKLQAIAAGLRDFFMEDFGILALIYAVLFKTMIWINMWRMRNEE